MDSREGTVEGGWRLIPFDGLPKATQTDVCCWIAERHPAFAEDADWTLVRDNLVGLVDPPMVWVGSMDVGNLHRTMERCPSERAVDRYVGMLRRSATFEFDPILVSGGRFLDGGHRMEAYQRARRSLIPVVEVGHLVDASEELWWAWLDNDDVRFEPGEPPSAEIPSASSP